MLSRRQFGRMTLAGIPLSLAFSKINSTVDGVRLGACTYSFRSFPRTPGQDNVDAVIQALTECDAGITELFSPNVEPAPAGGFRMRGPEAQKAREDLRQWRLSTPIDHFRAIHKKFSNAGIDIYAYTMNYRTDFTDPEIDATFMQAKGLGAHTIASSTTLEMAQRLAPFADKHKMLLALHGHSNTKDPNEFSSPETFKKGLAMSPYFRVNLDIGHFWAGGFDPVTFIEENHQHITHLHIKDRKKGNGPNMPLGEGDTPIKAVLVLLRDKHYPIPAFIEYEYKGTGTPVEEVKKCMAYMKQCVEGTGA
ncbi:MAG TPA: TIM barrel protein [Bryobacteraceae bacterium]|nr:TIM barrel protein [Bryobacteraceae bacterium]